MALIYICDYCQKPIIGQHYFFTVEMREVINDLPSGAIAGNATPVFSSPKIKAYSLHPEHFQMDSAGVATALYSDFNDLPLPEPPPEPAPDPTPAPDPAPDIPPDTPTA